MRHLQLRVTLVGFLMGGGEVARYLGKYGSKGVRKAVIISGVPPFLLKTADNQEGVDGGVFEEIQKAVAADRSATASLACVPTWHEDFRQDVARIDVPTLVLHGDADRILSTPRVPVPRS